RRVGEDMKRTTIAAMLLTALGGCVSTDGMPNQGAMPQFGTAYQARTVPGLQGPQGQPVAMIAPYNAMPQSSSGSDMARLMMSRSQPLSLVQQTGLTAPAGQESGIVRASGPGMASAGVPTGGISPPGVPFAPGSPAPGGPVPGAVAAPGALIGPPTS